MRRAQKFNDFRRECHFAVSALQNVDLINTRLEAEIYINGFMRGDLEKDDA